MADAAISFAVEKLGDALIKKVKFLIDVEEQVQWVKNELQSMRCFLKDADQKQGHDERIRQWILEVREVAQDIEDAIEIFTLKVDIRRNRSLLGRWACFPVHVNRVGKEILSIRSRLDEIAKTRERYGIQNLGMDSSSSRNRSELVELRRRMAARFQNDKDVVGLNQDADLILNKVIWDYKRTGLSLVAIVGMGGIGKSTLARKIYNHPKVAAGFEHRAWVVVSNEFEAEDIMKEIMQQLPFSLNPDELMAGEESRRQEKLRELRREHEKKLKEVESVKEKLRRQIMLQEMLRQRLKGKRYFIVLDDVWEHKHWDALKTAFPDEQGKASRLLFTSRNQIIREHRGYVHKMKLLNPEESWELLLKTAFIGQSEGRCPQELEEMGREMLKKCHGLPLAITVAGGLLVNEGESRSGWERVLKQIKNYHSETSEIGSNVSSILELSYHNLPSQLKPCFLCLSFFKEDEVIRAKRLVHIWVALGLVKVQEAGEESVEETGMGYLDELINRNLILVRGMSIDDRVIYCHVHDLLRELAIMKAKEEIGLESLIREVEWSSSSSSSSHNKPRHRVVRGIESMLVHVDTLNRNKHVRTLFLHVDEVPRYDDAYFSTPTYWKGFQLLRILDIESSTLRRLPSRIRSLIGIRYLRLREESGDLTLPSWLDVLKNLEILDVGDCSSLRFPDVTWRMDHLRHFYMNREVYGCKFSDSMKRSTWKNLETLKGMRADNLLTINPIQVFSQRLRKLGLDSLEKDGEAKVARLLSKSAVQVLHLKWHYVINDLYLPIPNALNNLTKLKLVGEMNWCPTANNFPQNITHLTLSGSRISRNDAMQELGKLPNLLVMKLHNDAISSMSGVKVSQDGFPRLKVVHLSRMYDLTDIDIEEGGMPRLQRLQIYGCPRLRLDDIRKRIGHVEFIIIAD